MPENWLTGQCSLENEPDWSQTEKKAAKFFRRLVILSITYFKAFLLPLLSGDQEGHPASKIPHSVWATSGQGRSPCWVRSPPNPTELLWSLIVSPALPSPEGPRSCNWLLLGLEQGPTLGIASALPEAMEML